MRIALDLKLGFLRGQIILSVKAFLRVLKKRMTFHFHGGRKGLQLMFRRRLGDKGSGAELTVSV